MTRSSLAKAAAAAICASAIIVGGPGGLLYTVIYALAAVPGLPIGFALFGREHPAGLVAGALIGYVLTAFGIWAAIATGVPSAVTFILAWLVVAAAAWAAARKVRGPLITLPEWNPRASTGLGLVLLLTLALSVPPFARLGARDDDGNRYYRAYFTADFVWHMALASELSKFDMPPRNPYMAQEPIHYYWAYFLLPAAASRSGPPPVQDVEVCLKVNALMTGLLLMSSVFLFAWGAVGRPYAVTAAVSLALLAASFEGVYELYRLSRGGASLGLLRDTNIDAITSWRLQGHRLDGLPRCLWYVPQHSMAYSLGLMALTGASSVGSTGSLTAIFVMGIALAGATALNPFVGGIFALAWGAAMIVDALRRPGRVVAIGRQLLAAVPVALALLWCISSSMVEGAGDSLQFGAHGASTHAPIWSLFLSLGPVIILALAGCALIRRTAVRQLAPAILIGALSLGIMYFVRLRVDTEWVPFRAGQMILVTAPALVAYGLASTWSRRALRPVVGVTFVLLLLLGLPTTVIDAFNAQDIENDHEGVGFRWTMVIPPEEVQAFAWIRRSTPEDAVVQMEPIVREREGWSLIPSFAERRMAAGLPISLMEVPAYRRTSERVQVMFATPRAQEAWDIAKALHIDYIYVDATDRAKYPETDKFDRSPELFEHVFRRGAVGVYRLR
jgi:hypothetical protein